MKTKKYLKGKEVGTSFRESLRATLPQKSLNLERDNQDDCKHANAFEGDLLGSRRFYCPDCGVTHR